MFDTIKTTKKEEVVNEMEDEEFMIFSSEDDNLSKMTIRDKYCITQNVPFTNKQWLNDLIKKGIKWKLGKPQEKR